MAIFPVEYVDKENIKIRWGERYVSAALNERMMGIPPGIYRGFNPVVVGNTVELQVNSEMGDSVGCAESSGGNPGNLSVRVDSTVVMDFTGHTAFPVWILLETDFSVGSITTARFLTKRSEEILATVGGSPAAVDLSTVLAPLNLPVVPGTVSIAVTLSGGAPATITDDGAGNLSGTGLSGAGTINYTTGAMTGTTQTLDAASDLVLTYRWEGLGRREIKVCKVDKPAAVLTVDTTMPDNRHEPLAYLGGTGFGFMPDGSLEDLIAAALTTIEVQDARQGFRPTAWSSLDERLDNELDGGGAYGLASRLALRGKMIETKKWDTSLTPAERFWSAGTDPGWAGTGSSANVSDDFRASERSTGPTVKGIVTDDDEEDIVRFMDRNFRQFSDNAGLPVYARLAYEQITITDDGSPGLTFVGLKIVTGTGTQFLTEIQAGDIILGPDANYYTVAVVNTDFGLELLENYGGTPGDTISGSLRRRYTLSFYTFDETRGSGSEEAAHSFTSATEFRYWYQELFDADDQTVYADIVSLRQKGYAAGTLATTDKPGIVELATDGETSGLVVVRGNDTRVNYPVQAQDISGVPIPGGPWNIIKALSGMAFADQGGGILGMSTVIGSILHNTLGNLDYASAGHVGFAPSSHTHDQYLLKFFFDTFNSTGHQAYTLDLSSANFTRSPLLVFAGLGILETNCSIGVGFDASNSAIAIAVVGGGSNDDEYFYNNGTIMAINGLNWADRVEWHITTLSTTQLILTDTLFGTDWWTSSNIYGGVVVVGQ